MINIVTLEGNSNLDPVGQRLKVLLCAYACEPGKGSEPGVGWTMACGLASLNDVWVLTRSNNRTAIESALKQRPVPSLHFIYYDLPAWARFWKRGSRGVHIYYYLWHLTSIFRVRAAHSSVGFDLSQHVTFVNHWMPSTLAFLRVPFIWGPVGTGDRLPRRFWRGLSFKGKCYELLRSLAQYLGEHDPLVLVTAQRCVLGLATTETTRRTIQRLGAKKTEVLTQLAFNDLETDGEKGNSQYPVSEYRTLITAPPRKPEKNAIFVSRKLSAV